MEQSQSKPGNPNASGEAAGNRTDPYRLQKSTVKDPPRTLLGCLKYLGPGFILSASIVGSGELIATTVLGAKLGFILLWFIIFSCVVKVAVQLEFGKYAIRSGKSTMASFNELPGPRLGSANWSIWIWLLLMLPKMLQVGGIVGGVVLVVEQLLIGAQSNEASSMLLRVFLTFSVAGSVSLLVFRGYYQLLEKASIIMIALFTVLTLASLVAVQWTVHAMSGAELASGLIPSIPDNTTYILLAIGAFGITGVGGDEIMAYNYWLIEKGYASYVGPKEENDQWLARARGWIKVMQLDALLAMVAYTLMTVMFYLLGATILHRIGRAPEDGALINVLSEMYTTSLGPWARILFLSGAFIVLYSTLFSALAAWSRMFSDAFGRIGLYSFENEKSRRRAIAFFAWVFPAVWGVLFLTFEKPAWMVILGGLATTAILLIVVFATLYLKYARADKELGSSAAYDVAVWVSSLAITAVAVKGLHSVWGDVVKYLGGE